MGIRVGDVVSLKNLSEITELGHPVENGMPELYSGFNAHEQSLFGNYVGVVNGIYQDCDSHERYVSLRDGFLYFYLEDFDLVESRNISGFDLGDKVVITNTGCHSGIYLGQTATVQEIRLWANDSVRYVVRVSSNNETLSLTASEIDICDENYVAPPLPVHVSCERCGAEIIYPDASLIDRSDPDYRLCSTCRKREFITPYHRYDPKIEFYSCDESDNEEGLFYGIELEVDDGGEYDSSAKKAMGIINDGRGMFIHCSHDGSLHEGFEIITQPATLAYHSSIRSVYKKLFKSLVNDGYRSHNTNSCGLHIHFSRKYYESNEEENISKLLYLVERFWDEIVIFSRRDYRSLERFAKKIDRDPTDFIEAWNKEDCHDGHYYSVNITNSNTIELRMFRGTLNINTFFATLSFVDSLVTAAKENDISTLQSIEFEDILSPEAKEYYESRIKALEYEGEE